MSRQEFIESHGAPRNASRIDGVTLETYRGRIPDDLIEFWRDVGFGFYVDGNYWLCEPALFDAYLSIALRGLKELNPADLAAFGYSCLGVVDLWHRSNRHLTFDIATGLLMDLTSLRETAAAPYDVEDLMAMAGVPRDRARETFLASRAAPENIWMSLGSAVDPEGYRLIYSDSGRQLVRELRRTHGRLQPGEIYLRQEMVVNEPSSYEKAPVAGAPLPRSIRYTRYVEIDGQQQPVEYTAPTR